MRSHLMWTVAGAVFLALTGAGVVQAADPQAQDRAGQHGDLAQRWADAWNSHDPDAVAALFTRDALFEDLPFGVVAHGVDEIRAAAVGFFTAVPDLQITVVKSSVRGGSGVVEWVFSGTDQGAFGTGKTFAVRGATVLEVRGNRIARDSDYYDLAALLRQLGLL